MASTTVRQTDTGAGFNRGYKPAALWLCAVFSAANAAWMLADPTSWYATVAGVHHTGPFNAHFVRDIGIAYLMVAACWDLAARLPRAAFPLAGVAAAFMVLHAGLHGWDIAAARLPVSHLLIDLPGVFGPAVLAVLLALWLHPEWRNQQPVETG